MAGAWSSDQLIPNADNAYGISESPALAVYNGLLYCVRQGQGDDGWLWCATFDGTNWSADALVPNPQNADGLSGSPALAVYNNLLYCVHAGQGNSGWTWCTTFDGTNWSGDALIPSADNAFGISESPALAVYNGLLYCVRQGQGDDGWLWCATFNGTNWSADALIPNSQNAFGLSGSPALAVYNGLLYCVHAGQGNSGWTWCATFDGTNWSGDALIPSADNAFGISESPALAVYNGLLYCVRQGQGDDGWLWCATFDGTNWSADALVPNSQNAFGLSGSPALAEYNGSLYCVRAGQGNSGWTWCASLPFGTTNEEIPLLDVWGEGRIVTDGVTTGFAKARNLNKVGQMVSNGPSKGGEVPDLVPVTNFDNPSFPIPNGRVDSVTLMGAKIVSAAAREMVRVLNPTNGLVYLYDPSQEDKRVFEENKGLLVFKPGAPLNPPFDQPSLSPVFVYGFTGDQDEL